MNVKVVLLLVLFLCCCIIVGKHSNNGYYMTTLNVNGPAIAIGTVAGAYSVKQILTGKLSGLFKGAGAGVLSAVYLKDNWKFAGLPIAIGTAASGWSDLSRLKIKSGMAKIFLAGAVGVGTDVAVKGQPVGEAKLKEMAGASALVVGAGLVQATVEGVWPYVEPVLTGVYNCISGAFSCCRRVSDAIADCTKKEPKYRPPQSSSITYC
jgi:hypothetical protein